MKKLLSILLRTVAVLGLGSAAVRAEDPNGEAALNKIYAQTLVNAAVDEHRELITLGLHGIPPGAKNEVMIAGNIDHIGNPDSEDDLAAAKEHKTLLEPKSPEKFEIVMPLLDAHGGYIGAVVMIFRRSPEETEAFIYLKAVGIRDDLAKKIPSYAALFDPAK